MSNEARELPDPKIIRFKRLQNLKCFHKVVSMIEASMPAREIAQYVQEEALEYVDVSRRYLIVLVNQFIGANALRFIDDQIPTGHLQLTNSLSEKVDPMDVYQVLLAVHSERIMMDYAQEKRNGRTTQQNTQNIRAMNDILKSMADVETTRKFRFKEFQQSRGVEDTLASLERAKQKYEERWGPVAAAAILNPESRRRILNALEQVRAVSTGPIADLLSARVRERTTEDGAVIIDAPPAST